MIESPDYNIRYTEPGDLIYLQTWLADPETLKYFPASDDREREMMANFWISFSRFRSSLTATFKDVPCGFATLFIMPYKKIAHHSLFYLLVDPKYRHQHVGSSLLKNIKHLAKTRFNLEHLQIEAWEGNQEVIDLLESHDFFLLMKQKGYVKENGHYLARNIYKTRL